MADKRGIRAGPVRRQADLFYDREFRLADGLVATDGVQYSPVASFGTVAVDILDKLLDPGVDVAIQSIYTGLTQKFERPGSGVGSLTYYWQARQESIATTRGYTRISPDFVIGVGSGATDEDTFNGYINVGSVPEAPVRIKLTALGLNNSSATGKVKNSSRVRLAGIIIPGA